MTVISDTIPEAFSIPSQAEADAVNWSFSEPLLVLQTRLPTPFVFWNAVTEMASRPLLVPRDNMAVMSR